jgi:hypothetical protein
MSTLPSHSDQHQMLREEVLVCIRETFRTEFSAALAVGVIYTWLLLHKASIPLRITWFIPPFILLVSGIRCLTLTVQLRLIAGYLRRIEKVAFRDDGELPGWESYMSARRYRWFRGGATLVAASVWLIVIIGATVASYVLSR